MRSVSWRTRVGAMVLALVLLVPAAAASNTQSTTNSGLWAEFVAWLESRLAIPPGVGADADGFDVWLMIRIHIPNG